MRTAYGGMQATRKSSQVALNNLAKNLPELIGGSADLTGSNNTFHTNSHPLTSRWDGNYLSTACESLEWRDNEWNDLARGLYLITLVFSDYARNA